MDKNIAKLVLDNSMFQAIFDSIGDGVVVTDSSGKILFYNLAATDITGLDSLKDIEPTHFSSYYNFYKPDELTPWPAGQDPLARAIQGKITVGEIMFVKSEPKSPNTLISCMAVPISFGTEPTIIGGIMMFRRIRYLTDASF